MAGYTVQSVDIHTDKDAVVKLWSDNFDGDASFMHKYDWLYQNNPFNKIDLQFLLDSEGNKVGVQGYSRRIFEFNGASLNAGLVADFAVDTQHRTLGPGLTLLKSILGSGLTDNHFIYSFPNKKAEPVFKRAGYKVKKEIIRYVRVLETRRYIENKIPKPFAAITAFFIDVAMKWLDGLRYRLSKGTSCFELVPAVSDELDKLWNNSVFKTNRLMVRRNKQYFDWRINEQSVQEPQILVMKNKKTDSYEGYIVFVHDQDSKAIKVVDFFAMDSQQGLGKLFSGFIHHAHQYNMESISVEMHCNDEIVTILHKLGFRSRESRAIYFSFGETVNDQGNNYNWFLTAWDEDAV